MATDIGKREYRRRREPRSCTIAVRVTETMRDGIIAIADEQDADVSDIVRDALDAHIAAMDVERAKAKRKAARR